MYLPQDVLQYRRIGNKAWNAGNAGAFIVHKFKLCLYEDVSLIKFLTSNFMSKLCPKINNVSRKAENKKAEVQGRFFIFFLYQLEDWTLDTLNEKLVICETMYE